MNPEKLLEISRSSAQVKDMFRHMAEFYLEAVVSGRAEQWKKMVTSYVDLVAKNEVVEKRSAQEGDNG